MSYTDVFSTDSPEPTFGMPTVNAGAVAQNAAMAPLQNQGVTPQVAVPQASTGVTPTAVVPAAGGAGAGIGGGGFFSPGGGFSMVLGGVQTLGNLWNSFQANKQAKKSFEFQKEAFYTNLENQEQSYNTELEDRISARYATEGRADVAGETASYMEKNRL